jgi:hypothetical protein
VPLPVPPDDGTPLPVPPLLLGSVEVGVVGTVSGIAGRVELPGVVSGGGGGIVSALSLLEPPQPATPKPSTRRTHASGDSRLMRRCLALDGRKTASAVRAVVEVLGNELLERAAA